jgi:hypothetical protein
MLTRLILRLPWFISTPTLLAGAVILAVGANFFAGPFFERTFLDEADPFAGVTFPAETTPVAAVAATDAPPTATPEPSLATPPAPSPSPAVTVAPVVAAPAGPVLIAEGSFVDGDPGHNGSGQARLIRGPDGSTVLRLEEFSVTNGPDLFVILSTDPSGSRGSASAAEAVNLGRLRATDGNINYPVPAEVDAAAYRSVIIYCRAFRVVFAVATLEPR